MVLIHFIYRTFDYIKLKLIKNISYNNREIKCYGERNTQVNCCQDTDKRDNIITCDFEMVGNTLKKIINDTKNDMNLNYVINPDIYHNDSMISLYPDHKYLSKVLGIYRSLLVKLIFITLFIVLIVYSPIPKMMYKIVFTGEKDSKYENDEKLFVLPAFLILYFLINVSMFSVSSDNPLWVLDTVDAVNFFLSVSLITISLTYVLRGLINYYRLKEENDDSKMKSNYTYLAIFVVFFIICLIISIHHINDSRILSEIYRLNHFENKNMIKVNWRDFDESHDETVINQLKTITGTKENNLYGSGIKTFNGLKNHFRLPGYMYVIICIMIMLYGIYTLYLYLTKNKELKKDSFKHLLTLIIAFSLYNLISYVASDKFKSERNINTTIIDTDYITNFVYKSSTNEYYGSIAVEDDDPLYFNKNAIPILDFFIIFISVVTLGYFIMSKNSSFKDKDIILIVVVTLTILLFIANFILRLVYDFENLESKEITDYTYYGNCTELDIIPPELQDTYIYKDVGLDMYIKDTVTTNIKKSILSKGTVIEKESVKTDFQGKKEESGHIFNLCLKNK
mgnify:CR=1 FL=1